MWPFDPNVTRGDWTLLRADGFPEPVPGCVYDGERLDGGIPLGGLGTGYFTIEGNGQVGHCSIYNDIVPPREEFKDWLTLRVGAMVLPLSSAEMAYWGHYPVADMAARFREAPIRAGIRAFAPFIPGDAADSNIPAALFEIRLRNDGREAMEVELLISPPTPPTEDSCEVTLAGEGLEVRGEKGNFRASISLRIPPGEAAQVRFVLAWYCPTWTDSTAEPHVHRYGLRYGSAAEVAEDVRVRFDTLLQRVLAWQCEIYHADLPGWLRDALVQGLYSFAKNSIWVARTRKDEWWAEDGWFSHSESHTGCPIPETMVCRMHGHFPTLFFFPELETSTLEAFRHFQISDGEVPFSFGNRGTGLRDPRYHCQHPLNSGQYAQMVFRLFLRTGDRELLPAFYDSARRAIRYQYSLDDDGDGLINEQAHIIPGRHWPANQFYDIWPWWGTSAYVAGTWLATLACGRAMAEEVGDKVFASECADRLNEGLAAYHEKLWTGSYYRLWSDLQNDRRSDVSLANQLMAEWCAGVTGLGTLLPQENVREALDTVERLNMGVTRYGLVNGVTPDGQRARFTGRANDHPLHTFVGENLCAAMTFMYHKRRETGLEIARRLYEAVALRSRSPWKQRCLISADTGLPIWGADYYSNMVIWAVPMALDGQDIRTFCAGGGLVARLIEAGKRQR